MNTLLALVSLVSFYSGLFLMAIGSYTDAPAPICVAALVGLLVLWRSREDG